MIKSVLIILFIFISFALIYIFSFSTLEDVPQESDEVEYSDESTIDRYRIDKESNNHGPSGL